jgi:hypothetical protein
LLNPCNYFLFDICLLLLTLTPQAPPRAGRGWGTASTPSPKFMISKLNKQYVWWAPSTIS